MSIWHAPEYTYVARAGEYVKIGISRDVRKRLRQLERNTEGTMPPGAVGQPITLVATFQTDDPRALERALHDAFSNQRIGNTEWFLADDHLERWCARRRPGSWLDTEADLDEHWLNPAMPPVDF